MKKQQLLYRFAIFCFSTVLLFSCKNENSTVEKNSKTIIEIDSLNQLAIETAKDSLKLIYAREAFALAKKNQNIEGIADACNTVGMVYKRQGDLKNAKSNLDSALFLNRQLNDTLEIAKTLYNLGELFLANEMLDSSRHCFLESHLILDFFGNRSPQTSNQKAFSTQIANVHLGLAKSSDLSNEPLSIIENHLQKAFYEFKKTNDSTGLIKTHLTYGKVFCDRDSLNEAIEQYTFAQKISESINESVGIAYSQNGLGAINWDLENFKIAEEHFKIAKKKFIELKLTPEIFDVDCNLCLIWLKTGLVEKAETAAERYILPIFKTEKNFESKEYAAYIFAEIYKEKLAENPLSKFADSLLVFKDLELEASENKLNSIKTKAISKLNIEYNSKRKDLEIVLKEKENQYTTSQRNWLLISLALLLPLFGFYYSRKKAKEALLVKEMETQKLEIETQKLKLEDQIQKAEVGAANSVISALEEERKKIARMIHDKLGSTLVTVNRGLRGYFKDSEQVSIDKKMLKSYTENLDEVYNDLRDISHLLDEQGDLSLIEKIEKFCSLFSNSGNMTIQFLREGDFSNIDEEMRNKLFLFSKELITNVLKYSDASKVEIQLLRFEKMITLSVIDDGKGFDLEKTPLGFGLSKMKSDVEGMNGSFLVDAKLDFGTTVIIDIPK